MNKRSLKIVFMLVMVMFLTLGCTTFNIGVKSWTERTPDEKALAILETYSSVYRNTLSQAQNPASLTDAQKKIVTLKKAILKEVYPLIGAYKSIVDGGGIPSQKNEDAILALIDKLGGKIAGR